MKNLIKKLQRRINKEFIKIFISIRNQILLNKNIKGIKNLVTLENAFFSSKCDLKIIGDNNIIKLGNYSQISNTSIFVVGNNNSILIGSNCSIKGGSLWIEDNNCTIKIGNNCSIESAHLAATEDNSIISLGEDCMFSYEIEVRTGDSHSIVDLLTEKRINKAKNVFIGNHVWIGAKVTILKGVTIGNNVVVGTGSILTSTYPDNSLVVGIPAKIIKNDITWKRERIK